MISTRAKAIGLTIAAVALIAAVGAVAFTDRLAPRLAMRWSPWPAQTLRAMARVSEGESHEADARFDRWGTNAVPALLSACRAPCDDERRLALRLLWRLSAAELDPADRERVAAALIGILRDGAWHLRADAFLWLAARGTDRDRDRALEIIAAMPDLDLGFRARVLEELSVVGAPDEYARRVRLAVQPTPRLRGAVAPAEDAARHDGAHGP